jgi:hypothetical protein
MSTRRGKTDSNSTIVPEGVAGLTVAEIEAVVQKAVSAAVSAAVSVLRQEFNKLFADINDRFALVDNRLNALETRYDDVLATNTSLPAGETMRELESIKKETRECRIATNDNEQYSRRNNVRIRGLAIAEGDDCRQIVADFCRTKLHLDSIQLEMIEAAHILPNRPKRSNAGGNKNQSATAATQKTESTVIVKFCRRELRDAVITKRKALKGTRYSILEDLTNLNVMTLNRVRNDDRVQTCWSWNGRIHALLKSGEKIMVKPYQPINECQRAES